MRAGSERDGFTRQSPTAPIDAAAASLKSMLTELIAHGASDLLVPNLPDVSLTPEVRSHGPQAIDEARRLSEAFNKAVDQRLADLPSEIRLYRLDVAGMAECARNHPASYGFTNITTPCATSGQCDKYLFWDGIHPTTFAHAHLAEAALLNISSAGRVRAGGE